MIKPHWRCENCDSSRYKVLNDGIVCYRCGRFTSNEEREEQNITQDKSFKFEDLEEIIKIKDRVIRTLLVGGGGALYEDEQKRLTYLVNKGKINLTNNWRVN